MTFDLN